jgi:hypothetical protein
MKTVEREKNKIVDISTLVIFVLVAIATEGCERSHKVALSASNGHLDSVATAVSGWAWNPTEPDAPVDVEILDDESPLATVKATGFREDLKRAGIGSGRYAFRLAVPTKLKDGTPHLIHARIASTKTELGGSPQTLLASAHEGHLDLASGTEICGWAWNPAEPDASVDVEILDDQTLLATVKADIYRKDLEKAGFGDGKHAFRMVVPAGLKDGKPHPIRARVAATKTELRNSPKTVLLSFPPTR